MAPEVPPAAASATADRRLVLVAGTGTIRDQHPGRGPARLGLHVPQPEVGSDATNPKGFGEPQWVVDFHDELLEPGPRAGLRRAAGRLGAHGGAGRAARGPAAARTPGSRSSSTRPTRTGQGPPALVVPAAVDRGRAAARRRALVRHHAPPPARGRGQQAHLLQRLPAGRAGRGRLAEHDAGHRARHPRLEPGLRPLPRPALGLGAGGHERSARSSTSPRVRHRRSTPGRRSTASSIPGCAGSASPSTTWTCPNGWPTMAQDAWTSLDRARPSPDAPEPLGRLDELRDAVRRRTTSSPRWCPSPRSSRPAGGAPSRRGRPRSRGVRRWSPWSCRRRDGCPRGCAGSCRVAAGQVPRAARRSPSRVIGDVRRRSVDSGHDQPASTSAVRRRRAAAQRGGAGVRRRGLPRPTACGASSASRTPRSRSSSSTTGRRTRPARSRTGSRRRTPGSG